MKFRAAFALLLISASFAALGLAESKNVKPTATPIRTVISTFIKELRPKPDLSLLEKFVSQVPSIPLQTTLEEKARALNAYIFDQWKIESDTSYLARDKQDNILPDSVLKARKGHCLGISILYLLAAERAQIQAYLVRVPDHVFVRICNGNNCRNIETLKGGAFLSDSDYQTEGPTPKAAIEKGLYLKSLSDPNEVLASVHLGLGFIAANSKQPDVAEFMYTRAAKFSPTFAEPLSNLASLKYAQGDSKEALRLLNAALKINPTHYATLVNLGALNQQQGSPAEALRFYSDAIQSNPVSAPAYFKRAVLLKSQKRTPESLLDLEKILIINPHFCNVREERNALRVALGKKMADPALLDYRAQGLCQTLSP